MGGRWGEGGRLLNFLAFRMGAYSRWALIRGWALIRINTGITFVIIEAVMGAQSSFEFTSVVEGGRVRRYF